MTLRASFAPEDDDEPNEAANLNGTADLKPGLRLGGSDTEDSPLVDRGLKAWCASDAYTR